MNKITFLQELEQYLQGISEEERKEAISYYENYFEDAGAENEEAVLAELGSPKEVASSILAELEEAKTEKTDTLPMPAQEKTEKRDNSKLVLISLLLIFTAPVWLGVVLGMIGALVGLIIAVVALVIGFGLASVLCIIAGIAVFIFGVFRLFLIPLEGVLCFGSGLLVFGIGILFFLAVLLCVQLIKFICKGIQSGCKVLFSSKKRTEQSVYS